MPVPPPVRTNVLEEKAKVTAKVAKSNLAKVAAQRTKETLDALSLSEAESRSCRCELSESVWTDGIRCSVSSTPVS